MRPHRPRSTTPRIRTAGFLLGALVLGRGAVPAGPLGVGFEGLAGPEAINPGRERPTPQVPLSQVLEVHAALLQGVPVDPPGPRGRWTRDDHWLRGLLDLEASARRAGEALEGLEPVWDPLPLVPRVRLRRLLWELRILEAEPLLGDGSWRTLERRLGVRIHAAAGDLRALARTLPADAPSVDAVAALRSVLGSLGLHSVDGSEVEIDYWKRACVDMVAIARAVAEGIEAFASVFPGEVRALLSEDAADLRELSLEGDGDWRYWSAHARSLASRILSRRRAMTLLLDELEETGSLPG